MIAQRKHKNEDNSKSMEDSSDSSVIMTAYAPTPTSPMAARFESSAPLSSSSSRSTSMENTSTIEPASGDQFNASEEPSSEQQSKRTKTHSPQSDQEETSQQQERSHFAIRWSNLDYVIDSKWWSLASSRKPILNGLSGCFESGKLSAILGPSGAGKSSLVDCLLGLKSSASLSGSIRVHFNNVNLETERRRSKPLRIALIPQQDHLLDTLTVMETFMFASRIKNAHLSSPGRQFDHLANVQRVLRQLNLTSCAKTRCAKLSGGQYKRVSIGQELLSRPELMILDEPTSGLDSVTCYQTVKALRDLIDTSGYPLAIVATIHQPDREVFSLFHKAYVLATGGRAIYEGPTDNIVDSIHMGIELVEARRKQLSVHMADMTGVAEPAKTSESTSLHRLSRHKSSLSPNNLETLSDQLINDPFCNPARVIVEVAANEYGFELISALNEMHKAYNSQLERDQNINTGTSMLYPEENQAALGGNEHRLVSLHANSLQNNIISQDPSIINNNSKSNNDLNCWTKSSRNDFHVSSGNLASNINLNSSFQSLIGSNKSMLSQSSKSFNYEKNEPKRRRTEQDPLLNLRKSNMSQKRGLRVHLKHVYYHTQRSWITILRDPMLFMLMLILHVTFPLLISYTFYSTYKADACPSVGPFDVLEEAYRTDGSNILTDLNREIRATFENLGYMFFQIYVIIFAGVCVTSLTYPLVMHVLVKEFRNGWYSITSYFIGRTLADLPVPTFNVFIAMAISYHLTGQPHSPYCWRFLCVAGLTILATLVAQTQGLMFGALLMNLPQSAVFVAPASTAPLVIVSGFLIRVANLPWILQLFSKLSFFSHLLNGFVVARYGFGRCGQCNETLFLNNDVPRIPNQARVIIDLWAETYASEYGAPNETETQLVDKLVNNIASAKMFGYKIQDCSQFKPFTMLDFDLEDYHLYVSFAVLAVMLIFFRWMTYVVLHWKIRSSI